MNLDNNSLVILKPDALKRHLVGTIIERFERRGFKIDALKMVNLSPEILSEHYANLQDRTDLYKEVESYMLSGPVIIMSLSSPSQNTVNMVREMIGSTDPAQAKAGTIRGDFATAIEANLIHASDSRENAVREHAIHFGYQK